MSYRISLLDKILVPEGHSPPEALRAAVALAQRAEALGYHRIWYAEHHGIPGLASSAPEIVAAYVLGQTRTIRIGSGGVMLQHYAPYKVAEAFHTLAALAPGRVDLGIGKAPGGLPKSTRALAQAQGAHDPESFTRKLEELDTYLTTPIEALGSTPLATPAPATKPERVLLGASPETAALAARLGWKFCYAGHFDSNPDRIAKVFDTYRTATGEAPWYSLVAFAAETSDAARALAGPLRLYRVRLADGQQVNLPTLDAAAEFARQSGGQSYVAEEIIPNVVSGTAADVRAELDALHDRYGVEEFVIDTPVAAFEARRASLEALAPARFGAPAPHIAAA